MAFSLLNNLVIHWAERGPSDAPAIVFANSLGTDFRIWDDVAARLGTRWRIVLHDKRGHGLSDAPAGPYSIDDHTDDLLALTDRLGLGRFALVGLSIGGLIAQNLALRAPERLAALVLADTAAKIGTADSWAARIDAVRNGGLAPIADAVMERWFTPNFRDTRPVDLAGWRNLLLRTPPQGYVGSCAAIRDTDLTERICTIAAPTLVVAGDQDLSTPPDLVRATADRIPGARFETIASCGHIPPVEQPAALAALIARHLEENGHV
ncbi:3-oxoadipate enol-lactonase [Kaistia dalseonensis]|uniref:3-oxoadipate enol-lactonase n=1 Tax=Kaistia dalseonensis TaxID=410840 RepID=A0ABU0H8M3_9HYPH|nr:3-oxoadipate enol-lactonase [Kaistia dalseonensis]MCX5496057.1 3-oxoadipate enol-lactonase [Kaistia dalseonensis]MDQ0438661.1 3-oxoadipate enol-lactonase [Kaistia dalseonensis]